MIRRSPSSFARRTPGLGSALLAVALLAGGSTPAPADEAPGGADPSATAEGALRMPGAATEALRPGRVPPIPTPSEPTREPHAGLAGEAFEPILYVPPSRGQALRTAAGGTRGTARHGEAEIAVLAPKDHVAYTTRAQPQLYWYVSKPVEERIDVTLIDDESIDPLLEITVPGPVRAGIHTLDLAAHGLQLEPGRTYTWHVEIVEDSERRSSNPVVEGFIARTGMTRDLERALGEAEARYAPYALSGIWYDALSEIEAALARDPGDRRLRRQQVALLEQVELPGVARYAAAQRAR